MSWESRVWYGNLVALRQDIRIDVSGSHLQRFMT
jgi:hypothetical protein